MENAPIALFVYNRPTHTHNLLESLVKNEEAADSVLYIFCDGAKANADENALQQIEQVREIARDEKRFKKVIVKKQAQNKGLGTSIVDGVTEVINQHGKIIVLEDDLILSPYFLSYQNDALNRYESNMRVGQIGGSNFFACGKKYPPFFFTPIPDCLGWGTWKNRWTAFNPNPSDLLQQLVDRKKLHQFNVYGTYDMEGMLKAQIAGTVSSWAIRWQAVCVMNDWLVLYPNPSMTNHLESAEATHANITINPPMWTEKPKFETIATIEIPKVIKAMKLSYAGYGDYFGKLKKEISPTKYFKITMKKRWKKMLQTILQTEKASKI